MNVNDREILELLRIALPVIGAILAGIIGLVGLLGRLLFVAIMKKLSALEKKLDGMILAAHSADVERGQVKSELEALGVHIDLLRLEIQGIKRDHEQHEKECGALHEKHANLLSSHTTEIALLKQANA